MVSIGSPTSSELQDNTIATIVVCTHAGTDDTITTGVFTVVVVGHACCLVWLRLQSAAAEHREQSRLDAASVANNVVGSVRQQTGKRKAEETQAGSSRRVS